jgi:hypothetical protein
MEWLIAAGAGAALTVLMTAKPDRVQWWISWLRGNLVFWALYIALIGAVAGCVSLFLLQGLRGSALEAVSEQLFAGALGAVLLRVSISLPGSNAQAVYALRWFHEYPISRIDSAISRRIVASLLSLSDVEIRRVVHHIQALIVEDAKLKRKQSQRLVSDLDKWLAELETSRDAPDRNNARLVITNICVKHISRYLLLRDEIVH